MKSKIFDVVGVSAAFLCLIHCIVFPLLLVIPFGLSHNPFVDLFFLLIGILVVLKITRKIKSVALKSLFWGSIALISVSVFADLIYEIHLPLIYFGAVGLISAHIINFRSHKH